MSLLIIAMAIAAFLAILQFPVSGLVKFVLVAIEMVLVSKYLVKRYKLSSEFGLILLKSRHGIALIERLAKLEKQFNFMADTGSTMMYGLLSVVMMRKNASLPSVIAGFVCLILVSTFVAPVALSFLIMVMKTGTIEKSAAINGGDGLGIVMLAILLLGGLFLFIISGIVMYGAVVLAALGKTIFFGTNAIAATSAGGTFLLPGINLPLLEGVIALAIVMALHEGAHAILARIARVPVLSSGIVLFGIIPVGAFVEPDEKRLERTERGKQTRVLVAGPSANLFASMMFFLLFMGFYYSTQSLRETGYLVQSGMAPDTIVYRINGSDVNLVNYTNLSLPKNASVEFATNFGNITKTTNGDGKTGITFVPLTRTGLQARFKVPGMDFIYMILGLALSLNFVVGAVNILPVPLFDGGRIIDINVKNKTLVKAISYTMLFFLIINFVPMLFHA